MKKLKILIPTLAIGTLSSVIPITGCSSKQDSTHIKDPTFAEKQIQAPTGTKTASYAWTLTADATASDTFEINLTYNEEYHLTVSDIKVENSKTLKFNVTINDELTHEGNVNIYFDATVVQKTNGVQKWTKTINECEIKFVAGSINSLVINCPDTVEYNKESTTSVSVSSYLPVEAQIKDGGIEITSSNPNIISVQDDNKLKALVGSGKTTITVKVTDTNNNTTQTTKEVNVSNVVTSLTISGEHNIDVDSETQYSFTVKDNEDRDQTKYCTWSVTDLDGNDTDRVSIEATGDDAGKLTIEEKGKLCGGSVKVIAKLGDTYSYLFQIELGSYSKIKLINENEWMKNGTALSGNLIFPTGIYQDDNFIEVKKINSTGFYSCGTFDRVYIASNIIEALGPSCFSGTTIINTIAVDPNNTVYKSDNYNCVMDANETKVYLGCKNTTLPNTITSIEYAAFAKVQFDGQEKEMDLENVVTIGDGAFSGSNIRKVNFGNKLEKIGNSAFKDCPILTDITFNDDQPELRTNGLEIGDEAFKNIDSKWHLTQDITFPKKTMVIGKDALYGSSILKIGFNGVAENERDWYYTYNDHLYVLSLQDGVTQLNRSLIGEGTGRGTINRFAVSPFTFESDAENYKVNIIGESGTPSSVKIPYYHIDVTEDEKHVITVLNSFENNQSIETLDMTTAEWCKTIAQPFAKDAQDNVLKEIILRHNLTTVPSKVFNNCTNLQIIDMSDFAADPSEYGWGGWASDSLSVPAPAGGGIVYINHEAFEQYQTDWINKLTSLGLDTTSTNRWVITDKNPE